MQIPLCAIGALGDILVQRYAAAIFVNCYYICSKYLEYSDKNSIIFAICILDLEVWSQYLSENIWIIQKICHDFQKSNSSGSESRMGL